MRKSPGSIQGAACAIPAHRSMQPAIKSRALEQVVVGTGRKSKNLKKRQLPAVNYYIRSPIIRGVGAKYSDFWKAINGV